MVILPNAHDASTVAYFNGGNYNLPVGVAGHLPWPGGASPIPGAALPAGLTTMPNALGAFISTLPNISDRSAGTRQLFRATSFAAIVGAAEAVKATSQFRRLGPVIAGILGVPPQPSLVRVLYFTSISSLPEEFPNFASTP